MEKWEPEILTKAQVIKLIQDQEWDVMTNTINPQYLMTAVMRYESVPAETFVSKGVSQPVQTAGHCEWGKEDEDNDCYYETSCGNAFQTLNGDYQHNHFTHCPYCGKPIKDKIIIDNDE